MLVSDIIDQSVIYQEVFFHLKDYLVLPLSYRYAWIETPGPQSSLTDCIYRTRAIISRSRFEAALVYKPRILSLKNEEFPVLVHKLSAI